MDIEKLIDTLKQHGVSCVRSYGKYCSICDEAATALSTLQAANEKLQTELEQVKRERDAAVESIPHDCKTCAYHVVFFNGCTPDHDCTNPDGGCSNNYDRWRWRGIKKEG